MLADLVDGADVRMVQGRSCTGFAPETLQSLRILRDIIGQELEGDKATKLGVLGFIDNTHAATAQLLDDAVMRDGLPDHWRESYVCETGKSMKAVELAVSQKGWRKINITLAGAYRLIITTIASCLRSTLEGSSFAI